MKLHTSQHPKSHWNGQVHSMEHFFHYFMKSPQSDGRITCFRLSDHTATVLVTFLNLSTQCRNQYKKNTRQSQDMIDWLDNLIWPRNHVYFGAQIKGWLKLLCLQKIDVIRCLYWQGVGPRICTHQSLLTVV